MGFCCQILSLNDLTPSPISQPGTHCLQWQRANARANLWWRHEPYAGETSIALRPCAGKARLAKRSWWCLGIIPSNICCQFSMISWILEEIHLQRSAGRRPQTTCLLCILRRILITGKPIQFCTWNIVRNFCSGWGGAACRTEFMLH